MAGFTVERHGRLYGACFLAPALFLGGCLLLGWLAPAAYRHWMDVPLAAVLVVPRCVAGRATRVRERMPYHLMGWGGDFEVESWKRA